MPKSTVKLEEQIRLARIVAWQNQLDGFTNEALKPLLASVTQAQNEIMTRLEHWAGHPTATGWSEDRSLALLDELEAMTAGIQTHLTGHVADMAGHAGSASLDMHSNILSWDGRAAGFNSLALTASQVRQLAIETPVGGRLLEDWISRTFDNNLASGIRNEIITGMLKGEGYPDLVARLEQGWDMTRTEATTLARTYVQSANVGAMQSVYKANRDIVKAWRWCATLEIGGSKGGGTCMQCAALDGNVYAMDEANVPEIPLHPRCRCVALPVTKTWRELGLDIDEMDKAYRPWTKSEDVINIGRGARPPEMQGFHQGSYADLFPKLRREEQLAVVGPGRLGLIESGEIKFPDLVDPATGRLRLLEGKPGAWTGLKGFGGPEGVGGLEMGDGVKIVEWTGKEMTNEYKQKIIKIVSSNVDKKTLDLVREYTGTPDVNIALRNDFVLVGYDKKQQEALDYAFSQIQPLRNQTIAYRGVDSLDYFPNEGQVFIDKGYVSTSLSKIAHNEIMEEMLDFVDNPIGVEIRITPGTKILPMQGKLSMGYFDYQDEGLLPRGTKFRVLKKTTTSVILETIP